MNVLQDAKNCLDLYQTTNDDTYLDAALGSLEVALDELPPGVILDSIEDIFTHIQDIYDGNLSVSPVDISDHLAVILEDIS